MKAPKQTLSTSIRAVNFGLVKLRGRLRHPTLAVSYLKYPVGVFWVGGFHLRAPRPGAVVQSASSRRSVRATWGQFWEPAAPVACKGRRGRGELTARDFELRVEFANPASFVARARGNIARPSMAAERGRRERRPRYASTVPSGFCPYPITNAPGMLNRSPSRQGSIEARYSARTEKRVDSSNRE